MSAKVMIGAVVIVLVIAGIIGFIATHRANRTKTVPPINSASTATAATIRYLPLGDSYTIGQSVAESDRWPNQLVQQLQAKNKLSSTIVANPSVTGYTTQNLIDRELPLVSKLKPNFVTILIGVNDYVQGVPATTFQKNLYYIISTVQKQLTQPKNIVLVTIPDYGKTPTGAEYGAAAASEAGIKAFNAIIIQAGAQHNLPVADIFPVSQAVVSDPSLIANDGLHPSGKEYAAWTGVIYQTLMTSGLLQSLAK